MNNIKTKLHTYNFDISDLADRAAYNALKLKLKAEVGIDKKTRMVAMHASQEWCSYNDRINALDGQEVELETDIIFDNQWNSAAVGGEGGLRLMDWYELIAPNKSIKKGYYLEPTPEMKEVREARLDKTSDAGMAM